jgi:hypothetical protein
MKNLLSITDGSQLEGLSQSELMSIDGGGFAYDLGHLAGSIALEVLTALVCVALL